LFIEIKNKNEKAIYYYALFFIRRMILASGLAFFYENSQAQTTT